MSDGVDDGDGDDADGKPLLRSLLDYALSFDCAELRDDVRAVRAKYPTWNQRRLADKLISRARWKGAGVGSVTGLPSNPWVMVPAAIADTGIVLRIELALAGRIGLLFDEHLLDGNELPYELMVPVMGAHMLGELGRDFAVRGGMGLTRVAIRKLLTKQTLRHFKRIMLKYLGLKVTQRAVLTKTLPVVGGLIGGTWNLVEVKAVGDRAYDYFSQAPP